MALRPPTLVLAILAVASAAAAEPTVSQRVVNDGNAILENVPQVPAELAARLHRYQNTRDARFQDWAADGEGLYITTRFGNTAQIHWVAGPGGSRRQLTFFDEPVGAAERQPSGADLTFLMDEGGSEFSQIFLLDAASGEHRRLTDGTSRNGVVEWSRDSSRIAFQSTRRNGESNDIWIMDPAEPDKARVVLESPDGSWWGAPLFVAQGQNDPRVPVTESEQIVRDVRSAGFDVWYMNALNEGHGFRKKENADLYRQIVVMFLRHHLDISGTG